MIRIGTRKSKLALWQAEAVKSLLDQAGHASILHPMSSKGDLVLDKPLHQIGGSGLFTKVLDDALWADEIDIAVHSLKDYPTQMPEGLSLAAVLPRASAYDMLVYKGDKDIFTDTASRGIIATGSPRRKAQWLYGYPNFEVVGLRGNVPTRLQKLADSDINGAIFAQAGIERLGLEQSLEVRPIVLSWMVPAPAQGIIAIVCRSDDKKIMDALSPLTHLSTMQAAKIERDFLYTVEGGCSAPVGSHVEVAKGSATAKFRGRINSLDGKQQINLEKEVDLHDADAGKYLAEEILEMGGKEILDEIREKEKA